MAVCEIATLLGMLGQLMTVVKGYCAVTLANIFGAEPLQVVAQPTLELLPSH